MNELRNDVESLKLAFPEISLGMETDQLRNSLINRLKLRATVTQNELTAEAKIQLNDGYYLILRPNETGFNGTNFWYRWTAFQHRETGEERIFHSLRALVELHYQPTPNMESERIISFGIEASSSARAMEKAIEKIADLQGLRLVALPIIEIL